MWAGGGARGFWNGVGDGKSSDLRRLDLLSFLLSFAIAASNSRGKEGSEEGVPQVDDGVVL